MRPGLIVVAAALVVSGCHRNDYGKSDDLSHKDEKAAAAIDSAVAENSTAAKLSGLPVPQPSAHALAYELPVSYIGKWGMTKADCDPDRPDTKGLLTINSDKLIFYESKGSVLAIEKRSPYDITVKLDMTGEGQEWTTITRLKLDAASTQLVRTEQSPAQSYRYQRC